MLPSLGFTEIVALGILALVVVGPKDLPLMLRRLGRWTAKLRGMAQEFRSGFDELARQAELDELRKEVNALRQTTSEFSRDVRREFTQLDKPAQPPRLPPPPATPALPDSEQSGAEQLETEAAPAQIEQGAAPAPNTNASDPKQPADNAQTERPQEGAQEQRLSDLP